MLGGERWPVPSRIEREDKNMTTLEREREIMGAKQDMHGRYYVQNHEGYRTYGYNAPWSGAYVCYTCGHLCDCGEGEE